MMRRKTQFPGGLAWEAPWPNPLPALRHLQTPATLRIPVLATGGDIRPSGAAVRSGEALATGDAQGPLPLSPANGIVRGVDNVRLLGGGQVPAVRVQTHRDQSHPGISPRPARPADLPGWIDLLCRNGVSASRRECPDLIAQLRAARTRRPAVLICNLLDDDPRTRLAGVLWRRHAVALLRGLMLLAAALSAKQACLVVADDWPGRIRQIAQRLAERVGAAVVSVPPTYPQSHPALLLLTLLQKPIRRRDLPTEAGAVIADAAALLAVDGAARRGRPMLRVPLAIHDTTKGRTHYASAPVGMRLGEAMEQLGISHTGKGMGTGAMLEQIPAEADDIIGPGALTVHVADAGSPVVPAACIRCGWCVQVCPTRVQPAGLLEAAQLEDPELADRHGLRSCIECGLCDYVCPAHLPLLEAIRELRAARHELPARAL